MRRRTRSGYRVRQRPRREPLPPWGDDDDDDDDGDAAAAVSLRRTRRRPGRMGAPDDRPPRRADDDGAALLRSQRRLASRLLMTCCLLWMWGGMAMLSGAASAFVRRATTTGPSLLLPSTRQNWSRNGPPHDVQPPRWGGDQQPAHCYSVSTALGRRAFVLLMGKGDGKTRKPKKKQKDATAGAAPSSAHSSLAASPTGGAATSSAAAPLRVSSNSNVPVRQQILMAQLNKQVRQGAGGQGSFRRQRVERTSYRRTWDEEEVLEKAEQRKRKGQDPDWDVILSRNATLPPLLIVDGYNIIHKWSRLKKHMQRGDLARARQLLVDDLENLASLKGWRIEVVFDGGQRRLTAATTSLAAALRIAQGGGGTGASAAPTATQRAERSATKDVSKHGVRVVYTGSGVEADSYIESRCATAKNVTSGKWTGSFLVATDDQMVRMAGTSAGALCMGAERLVTELKAVRQSVAYRVEMAVAAANGHAVRPDALLRRGTSSAASSAANWNRRFGRGSVVIEDKRKQKEERKKQRKSSNDDLIDLDIKVEVEGDENGIPWWAKVPNQTHTYQR